MSREPFSEEFDAALDEMRAWVCTPAEPGCCLVLREPQLPSQDLATLHAPIAECCMSRRVSLTDDRSEFTREAFGSFL